MSKKPAEIATGTFIFNNVTARGFSLGTWVLEEQNQQKVREMFEQLQALILSGELQPPPHCFIPLGKFKETIQNAICEQLKCFDECHFLGHGTKQILLISAAAGAGGDNKI